MSGRLAQAAESARARRVVHHAARRALDQAQREALLELAQRQRHRRLRDLQAARRAPQVPLVVQWIVPSISLLAICRSEEPRVGTCELVDRSGFPEAASPLIAADLAHSN